MIKSTIIADNSYLSYAFFYPLYVNRDRLKKRGLECVFCGDPKKRVASGDVLMLDSKCFRRMWSTPESVFALIEKYRKKFSKIIWLDTSDSTGVIQPKVMPYVDSYAKKQLLKDKNLYTKPFYNTRIYSAYYKDLFKLPDEEAESKDAINKEDIVKLKLAWNLGTGPFEVNKWVSNAKRLIPQGLKNYFPYRYHLQFVAPDQTERRTDVCCRGSARYNNLAQSAQRLKVLEKMRAMGVDTQIVPRTEYINEMRQAKTGISPFGAGEICLRDYELLINGAIMIKPDMTHLETWPDIYKPHETYIPCAWDLSDLEEIIRHIVAKYGQYAQIAGEAQEVYREYVSEKGMEEFCDRLLNLLQ